MTPLNLHSPCRRDFVSLAAFDEHITAKPSERVSTCLSVAQMLAKGWVRDGRGRWSSPRTQETAGRARERFSAVGVSSETPSEGVG